MTEGLREELPRSHFSSAIVPAGVLFTAAIVGGVVMINSRAPARTPPVSMTAEVPPVVRTWVVERSRPVPRALGPDATALAAASQALSNLARSNAGRPPGPGAAGRQFASLEPGPLPQASAGSTKVDAAKSDAATTDAPHGADVPRVVPALPTVAAPEKIPVPLPRPSLLAPPREDADDKAPRERDDVPRRPSRRRTVRETPASPAAAEPEDKRNPLERLFGLPQPGATTTTVTAYAPTDGGVFGRKSAVPPASPSSGGILEGLFGGSKPSAPARGRGGTAVYDISAHTVYLPDGRQLEAHSGLGAHLDDPDSVRTPNRGATPPNVYDLSLRESAFHGVRALRLSPVGGTTFGRNGLLAHTYMLGARGDSNGCVVFRDYDTFLRAFESGTVSRLEVVARR